MTHQAQICRAIDTRMLLEFDYGGAHRIVAPYCHGWTHKGVEAVRAVQVGGTSPSAGFGFGKLWHVDKMTNVRVSDEGFSPADPNYNPADSAMARIHCRI